MHTTAKSISAIARSDQTGTGEGGRGWAAERAEPVFGACPVTSLCSWVYRVPTDGAEADGTLAWSSTTAVVVEVRAEGVVGTGWTYGSEACATIVSRELSETVIGTNVLDVPRAHEAMVRGCRNIGRPGAVACAISAVDVALWDLKARVLGVSLADLFGRCRDQVALYGSGGFTTYDDGRTSEQLTHWVGDLGIPRVKIKVGESRGTAVHRDLARAALARRAIGPDAELFVDANGAYTAKQALRVGRRYQDECGVSWFEEPVSSDDLSGLRLVRQDLSLDVTAGEYGYDESYFRRMLEAESVDCLQIDVTRCGGYSGWLRAAAIAASHGLEVSAHCAPQLHAHIAVSVPNCRHVEYFHDHVRADGLLFDGLAHVRGGTLSPLSEAAGHGMSLNHARAQEYQVGN